MGQYIRYLLDFKTAYNYEKKHRTTLQINSVPP